MKYSLDTLADYIAKGLIIKQVHPTLPLSIYNYSRTCQYGASWDEITLACRGLVLDNEGNVIAKPFPKFFNYEEHNAEEIAAIRREEARREAEKKKGSAFSRMFKSNGKKPKPQGFVPGGLR